MEEGNSSQSPCKSILKTSGSTAKSSCSKMIKFDETNLLQTLHPIDKDYGHMKIDEPKTPYHHSDAEEDIRGGLDTDLLIEKLRTVATERSTQCVDRASSGDDQPVSEIESKLNCDFLRRRKSHYREFEAVNLARKLMQDDDEDEDVSTSANTIANMTGNKGNTADNGSNIDSKSEEIICTPKIVGDEPQT